MNSSASPRSRRSASRIAITSDWIVTSRAVVGSSASSRSGSVKSAVAIMTRWSIPPDSSCGYCRRRRSPSSIETSSSSASARRRASAGLVRWLVRSASVMKSPIRRTGLTCTRASWNTIPTSLR